MSMLKNIFFALCIAGSLAGHGQQLKLPRLFADQMILQRETPVRFWGWGEPGGTVIISIDGFVTKTLVNPQGEWECLFPAHMAGGPYDVVVTGDDQITFSDVYFGDVWIAGGQSNMEWPVSAKIDNMEKEIADSNYPQIRFFNVKNTISVTPKDDLEEGDWKKANPENVGDFSAVAWFFAKRNHLEKGVPVGVISSNWGGTPAETWTSAERLLGVDGYRQSAAEMMDPGNDWEALFAANEKNNQKKWQMIQDKESFLAYDAFKLDFDDSAWEDVTLPNGQELTHFVWLRKSVTFNNPKAGKLSLGKLVEYAQVFVNGELVFDKGWNDPVTTIDLKKGLLLKGENVVTIRVINGWDNKAWVGEKGQMWLKSGKEEINLEGTWKYSNQIDPPIPLVEKYEWKPGTLFNAMIHPIAGYSIKGAIWYQGESNAGVAQYYNELFEAMIQDWRLYWKQGNFPFLFVQLANWLERKSEPSESNWAALREAQTETLQLPKTGMALAIDIGDEKDIHPRNKQDVGKRLWLAAQKVAFCEDLVYSGPKYQSHIIQGNKVIVTFDHTGGGLEARNGSLTGFALAGNDGKYYWADGTIEEGKVVLTSENVAEPVSVRYAWADNPVCNLYNKEGLPAIPFRTDKK